MLDDLAVDEPPQTEFEKFTTGTYNVIMDNIVESIRRRVSKNMQISADLAILDPNHFDEIRVKNCVPDGSLHALSGMIKRFNELATPEKLGEELISFACNWEKFRLTLDEQYAIANHGGLENTLEMSTVFEVDEHSQPQQNRETTVCNSCRNCPVCCYRIILKYNLFQEVDPALATAYQYLLTLPISQVACERCFQR